MIFVLDTNVVLYHLAGRLVLPLPPKEVCISIITEIELLSYPLLTQIEEDSVRHFLSGIPIVGLREDIKNEAINLRRSHRLKLADSIIAATAMVTSGTLLTYDASLLKVAGINVTAPDMNP